MYIWQDIHRFVGVKSRGKAKEWGFSSAARCLHIIGRALGSIAIWWAREKTGKKESVTFVKRSAVKKKNRRTFGHVATIYPPGFTDALENKNKKEPANSIAAKTKNFG